MADKRTEDIGDNPNGLSKGCKVRRSRS